MTETKTFEPITTQDEFDERIKAHLGCERSSRNRSRACRLAFVNITPARAFHTPGIFLCLILTDYRKDTKASDDAAKGRHNTDRTNV
jgi:hypothetical protein